MADIQRIIADITDLPTLPDVVTKVNQLISDSNTSAADINKVISRDLALSAKILKLVNSPFYGFPRRITTITYAVVILGFNTVRNLALSAFVFDAFKKGSRHFDAAAFWKHSICTAFLSQDLAKKIIPGKEEDAFIAGLLHGVGKVVMSQYLLEDMKKVAQRVEETGCQFTQAESELLDYNHAELGAALLEKWNLPEPVVGVVRNHLNPQPGEKPTNVEVVHLSNILTRALNFGSSGDSRIPQISPAVWSSLGLTWADVDALLGQVVDEIRKGNEFLSMI
jgi:putative nucleotidyltransferase with HDIG domain